MFRGGLDTAHLCSCTLSGQSTKIGLQGKFGRFQKNDWWQARKSGDEEATMDQIRKNEQILRDQLL